MLDFLPPLDVGNPKVFIAGITAIFASYPVEVMEAAVDPVKGIPARTDRPTLKLITEVCEEIYDPIRRRAEYEDRQRARDSAPALLPRPPRSAAQQAVIDAQVASARSALGIPPAGLKKYRELLPPSAEIPMLPPSAEMPMLPPSADSPTLRDDGKHASRIAADLAARAARNQATTQEDSHEHRGP